MYYGQCREDGIRLDQVIHETFFKDFRGGFFVECGAFDGHIDSTCKFFEESMGWRGLNIEPVPYLFDKLQKNRPYGINEKVALSDKDGVAIFTNAIHPVLGRNFGCGSLSHSAAHKKGIEKCEKETFEVNTIRFSELYAKHNLPDIDLFILDVEGHEEAALRGILTIPFHALPKVFCIEHAIVENDPVVEMLRPYYVYHSTTFHDVFFVKRTTPYKGLKYSIAAGIGDNIVLRMALDTVKHNYSEIRISHNKAIIEMFRHNDSKYIKFLDDLGNLLFNEPPYVFDHTQYPEIQTYKTYCDLQVQIKEPQLDHLLCQGTPLSLDKEYIVITTKIRTFPKNIFDGSANLLWEVLNKLGDRYKIVILGERKIQGPTGNDTFCIYDQITKRVKKEHLVDLTVDALGITAPSLSHIQQDCLVMKNAKFTLAFGIGGNVWMAAAVGKTLNLRSDSEQITNIVANPNFKNLYSTREWVQLINTLNGYVV